MIFERCKPGAKRAGLPMEKGDFGKKQAKRSNLPLLGNLIDHESEEIFDDAPDFHRQVKAEFLSIAPHPAAPRGQHLHPLLSRIRRAFFLRTRLDDGDVTTAHSAVDYNNEASIFFYDPDIAPKSIADGFAGNFGRTVASAPADKDEQSTGQTVAKFAGALTGLFAGSVLETAGAGTIKNLEAASSLHIEVPMADDRKPMITIALAIPRYSTCSANAGERQRLNIRHPNLLNPLLMIAARPLPTRLLRHLPSFLITI